MLSSVLVVEVVPYINPIINSKTNPNIKLLITPATITSNRLVQDLLHNLWSSGTLLSSSKSSSPAIETYPPSGINLTIYSVSSFFLLNENNFGPNPKENSYT